MANIIKNYDNMWQAFVKPHRQTYSAYDLGQQKLCVQKDGKVKKVKREDFNLKNKRNQNIVCSFYTFEDDKKYPCLVYLHCNSGTRLEGLTYLQQILKQDIQLFVFDFAGCGLSEGEYISLGYYEIGDVQVVVDYLKNHEKVSKIALWGRSMGAVTAIMYGSQCKNNEICVSVYDSPFCNLMKLAREIAKSKTGLPKFIVSGALSLIKNSILSKANFDIEDLDIIKYSQNCEVPALFVASQEDTFTKHAHSEKLQKAYKGQSSIFYFNGEHNEARPEQITQKIIQFISEQIFLKTNQKQTQLINPYNYSSTQQQQQRNFSSNAALQKIQTNRTHSTQQIPPRKQSYQQPTASTTPTAQATNITNNQDPQKQANFQQLQQLQQQQQRLRAKNYTITGQMVHPIDLKGVQKKISLQQINQLQLRGQSSSNNNNNQKNQVKESVQVQQGGNRFHRHQPSSGQKTVQVSPIKSEQILEQVEQVKFSNSKSNINLLQNVQNLKPNTSTFYLSDSNSKLLLSQSQLQQQQGSEKISQFRKESTDASENSNSNSGQQLFDSSILNSDLDEEKLSNMISNYKQNEAQLITQKLQQQEQLFNKKNDEKSAKINLDDISLKPQQLPSDNMFAQLGSMQQQSKKHSRQPSQPDAPTTMRVRASTFDGVTQQQEQENQQKQLLPQEQKPSQQQEQKQQQQQQQQLQQRIDSSLKYQDKKYQIVKKTISSNQPPSKKSKGNLESMLPSRNSLPIPNNIFINQTKDLENTIKNSQITNILHNNQKFQRRQNVNTNNIFNNNMNSSSNSNSQYSNDIQISKATQEDDFHFEPDLTAITPKQNNKYSQKINNFYNQNQSIQSQQNSLVSTSLNEANLFFGASKNAQKQSSIAENTVQFMSDQKSQQFNSTLQTPTNTKDSHNPAPQTFSRALNFAKQQETQQQQQQQQQQQKKQQQHMSTVMDTNQFRRNGYSHLHDAIHSSSSTQNLFSNTNLNKHPTQLEQQKDLNNYINNNNNNNNSKHLRKQSDGVRMAGEKLYSYSVSGQNGQMNTSLSSKVLNGYHVRPQQLQNSALLQPTNTSNITSDNNINEGNNEEKPITTTTKQEKFEQMYKKQQQKLEEQNQKTQIKKTEKNEEKEQEFATKSSFQQLLEKKKFEVKQDIKKYLECHEIKVNSNNSSQSNLTQMVNGIMKPPSEQEEQQKQQQQPVGPSSKSTSYVPHTHYRKDAQVPDQQKIISDIKNLRQSTENLVNKMLNNTNTTTNINNNSQSKQLKTIQEGKHSDHTPHALIQKQQQKKANVANIDLYKLRSQTSPFIQDNLHSNLHSANGKPTQSSLSSSKKYKISERRGNTKNENQNITNFVIEEEEQSAQKPFPTQEIKPQPQLTERNMNTHLQDTQQNPEKKDSSMEESRYNFSGSRYAVDYKIFSHSNGYQNSSSSNTQQQQQQQQQTLSQNNSNSNSNLKNQNILYNNYKYNANQSKFRQQSQNSQNQQDTSSAHNNSGINSSNNQIINNNLIRQQENTFTTASTSENNQNTIKYPYTTNYQVSGLIKELKQ